MAVRTLARPVESAGNLTVSQAMRRATSAYARQRSRGIGAFPPSCGVFQEQGMITGSFTDETLYDHCLLAAGGNGARRRRPRSATPGDSEGSTNAGTDRDHLNAGAARGLRPASSADRATDTGHQPHAKVGGGPRRRLSIRRARKARAGSHYAGTQPQNQQEQGVGSQCGCVTALRRASASRSAPSWKSDRA